MLHVYSELGRCLDKIKAYDYLVDCVLCHTLFIDVYETHSLDQSLSSHCPAAKNASQYLMPGNISKKLVPLKISGTNF